MVVLVSFVSHPISVPISVPISILISPSTVDMEFLGRKPTETHPRQIRHPSIYPPNPVRQSVCIPFGGFEKKVGSRSLEAATKRAVVSHSVISVKSVGGFP